MLIPNKFLSATVLLLSMMSASVFTLAYAQDGTNDGSNGEQQGQEQQSQEQQNQDNSQTGAELVMDEEPYEDTSGEGGSSGPAAEYDSMYDYPTSGSSYDSEFGAGEDASDMIDDMSGTVDVDNTTTIGEGTSSGPGEGGPIEMGYPSFSQDEINQLFNVSMYEEDENALAVEPVEGTEEGELGYLQDAVQLHSHRGIDPVYTYGKDKNDKGVCAGTDDFCTKSAAMWENFDKKLNEKESLTITEGENKNQLEMPNTYVDNSNNMPKVIEGPEPYCRLSGFTPYPNGNEHDPEPHCGALSMNGANYYSRPIYWK